MRSCFALTQSMTGVWDYGSVDDIQPLEDSSGRCAVLYQLRCEVEARGSSGWHTTG